MHSLGRRVVIVLCSLSGLLLMGPSGIAAPENLTTIAHASGRITPEPYHLHLNGIGGFRIVDRFMLSGLKQGGLDADVQAYDWCGDDAGLGALLQQKLHVEQSKIVAGIIAKAARAQPGRRITLSAHSAGAGIIIWALEDLPKDVKVDSLALLSPALSPEYDLSKALKHITGNVYVFYSTYDEAVLGLGTRLFGTVDGIKTDAAGRVGFKEPAGADREEYAKIIQVPYEKSWIRLGNIGDHIGSMSRPFARQIIAPLLLKGILPRPELVQKVDAPDRGQHDHAGNPAGDFMNRALVSSTTQPTVSQASNSPPTAAPTP
jgi:hypothetical protein